MTAGLGLLLAAIVGGIIVILCFVQDAVGSLKFWRSRS
jgi:hypothetical protein